MIGGFPKNCSKQVRATAVRLVVTKLIHTKRHFDEPTSLYDNGQICTLAKKAESPWAAMTQAVEEYNSGDPVTFAIRDQTYTLWLGTPKSPERRKRNQVLKLLAQRAEDKGAQQVAIDWWRGDITVTNRRIATVTERAARAALIQYVKNPFLGELATAEWLSEQQRIFRANLDWQ